MNGNVFIYGTGGHGRELASIALAGGLSKGLSLAGFVDDADCSTRPFDLPVLKFEQIVRRNFHVLIGVGMPQARKNLVRRVEEAGLSLVGLRHPSAIVLGDCQIADTAVLFPGVVVTAQAIVGPHVHLNVGSSLSHDSTLGAYATLSPGARVAGHVQIGEGAFLGVSASTINGTRVKPLLIGDWSYIAAGSCVTRPVAPGMRVAGVPAKPLP